MLFRYIGAMEGQVKQQGLSDCCEILRYFFICFHYSGNDDGNFINYANYRFLQIYVFKRIS